MNRNMNRDLFRYKLHFISIILVMGYTYLHLALTKVYVAVTFENWVHLNARLPFGQRLLLPTIAHYLNDYFLLSPAECFFILEGIFVALFLYAMVALLKTAFTKDQSLLLGWLCLLLLPLVTVVNYTLTYNQSANLYYPYDSASLFFMTMGFLLCLKSRWVWLALLVFIATLNRESSILLVLLIPALHWQRRKDILKPLIMVFVAYLVARGVVYHFVQHLPGQWMECYATDAQNTHFATNVFWLFQRQNIHLFLFTFAGLPLLWFALSDYIPVPFRPIRYVAFTYFLGLLLVAKFAESRIFGEIVVLLYFPVCLAVRAWWADEVPTDALGAKGWLFYLDRYVIIGLLLLIMLFHRPLAMAFKPALGCFS